MIVSEEEAKAVQEVSKLAGKALDTTKDVGSFVSRIFGTAPEDLAGLVFGDYLKQKRARNYMKMEAETVRIAKSLGYDASPKEIPLKFGVRLLEAATVEEDDDLLKIWGRLLANATNPKNKESTDVAFISVLNEMCPKDANVFNFLYRRMFYKGEDKPFEGVRLFKNMPHVDSIKRGCSELICSELGIDYIKLRVCIDKLQRSGLVKSQGTGNPDSIIVDPTHFGVSLYRAVKDPTEE